MTEVLDVNKLNYNTKVSPHNPMPLADAKKVLVTGGTGFLGAYLLERLLKNTTAEYYCLVRADDAEKGAARIKATFDKHDLLQHQFDERVIVVTGDLTADRFGLDDDTYKELQENIDTVFHLGASINWLATFADMKVVNVAGTDQVLEFATGGSRKTLHYVSTTGVFYALDAVENGYLNNDVPLERYSRHIIAYFKSKWMAELRVQEAFNKGLSGFISRPSFVGGTLDSGYLPEHDLTRLFLTACLESGSIPDVELLIDIAPVDVLADAIMNIAVMADREKRIYNLSNPTGVSMTELGDIAKEHGLPIELVSHEEWQKKLAKPPVTVSRRVLRWLSQPVEGAEGGLLKHLSSAKFDMKHIDTKTALAGTDIECPPVNTDMLMAYLGSILLRNT